MARPQQIKTYLIYSFVGGSIMLVCMLIGEYLHGPIFNDFLNKKYLWPIAFLETVLWIVPLSWLNCFLIKKVPNLKSVGRVILSTTFWIGLSMSVFLIYHLNADPGWQLWSKANLSHAYVYGWYIPGAMMIIIFALLSLKKDDTEKTDVLV